MAKTKSLRRAKAEKKRGKARRTYPSGKDASPTKKECKPAERFNLADFEDPDKPPLWMRVALWMISAAAFSAAVWFAMGPKQVTLEQAEAIMEERQ